MLSTTFAGSRPQRRELVPRARACARSPSKEMALSEMVKAWAGDVTEGREALLVAYHRESVEDLNNLPGSLEKAWKTVRSGA